LPSWDSSGFSFAWSISPSTAFSWVRYCSGFGSGILSFCRAPAQLVCSEHRLSAIRFLRLLTEKQLVSRAFGQQVKFGNAVLRQLPCRCCLMAPVCRSTFTPLDFSVNSPYHSPVECKHGSSLRFGPRDVTTQFPRFAAVTQQVVSRCNQKLGQLGLRLRRNTV
jgi:hypothetical protein